MSVNKLLSRIVAPDLEVESDSADTNKRLQEQFAATPLTQFAIVMSALLHDLDHPGVPNGQLAKEEPGLAATYKNQAIAEQNSIHLGWEILMEDQFQALRACIYDNPDDFKRFRQIVVNNILATGKLLSRTFNEVPC